MGRSCYHMLDVRERPADPDAWGDAYEGRPPSWEEFFGGYGATVDWPAAPFWPETGAAFPDALVPLSVREADSVVEERVTHHLCGVGYLLRGRCT